MSRPGAMTESACLAAKARPRGEPPAWMKVGRRWGDGTDRQKWRPMSRSGWAPSCSSWWLAASADAVLEADRRGLSSRSQDGRLDPGCWLPDRCDRKGLYEGAESLDFHVSVIGDELIMSGGPR